MNKILTTTGLALALLAFGSRGASAQLVPVEHNIDISSYFNGTWGSGLASAPTVGNTGSGYDFGLWNGNFDQISGETTTLTFTPVSLGENPWINALFNVEDTSTSITVTFTNNLGYNASYSLLNGQTIADWSGGSVSGYGVGVSAVNWETGDATALQAQNFLLPGNWAGTTLESVTVSSLDGSTDFSALQAGWEATPPPPDVPEPMSMALFGVGCIGLAGTRRRVALNRQTLT